jgi:hypothetical protein
LRQIDRLVVAFGDLLVGELELALRPLAVRREDIGPSTVKTGKGSRRQSLPRIRGATKPVRRLQSTSA